jgi:hypothetical protein
MLPIAIYYEDRLPAIVNGRRVEVHMRSTRWNWASTYSVSNDMK